MLWFFDAKFQAITNELKGRQQQAGIAAARTKKGKYKKKKIINDFAIKTIIDLGPRGNKAGNHSKHQFQFDILRRK